MSALPTVALSIQQPWAWLIVNGLKDIENRTWTRAFRGPVLIHAGKKIDDYAMEELMADRHPVMGTRFPDQGTAALRQALLADDFHTGGIVGVAQITGVVTADNHAVRYNSWFVGPYSFTMANGRPLPFMPMRGMLGFFPATYVLNLEGQS